MAAHLQKFCLFLFGANLFSVVPIFCTHSTNNVFVNRDAEERQAETAGEQGNPSSSSGKKSVHELAPSVSQRARSYLPRSAVYLSMRRLTTTEEIEGVIGRALKREKDGVLEAPQQSVAVLFLDDVNVAQEV